MNRLDPIKLDPALRGCVPPRGRLEPLTLDPCLRVYSPALTPLQRMRKRAWTRRKAAVAFVLGAAFGALVGVML